MLFSSWCTGILGNHLFHYLQFLETVNCTCLHMVTTDHGDYWPWWLRPNKYLKCWSWCCWSADKILMHFFYNESLTFVTCLSQCNGKVLDRFLHKWCNVSYFNFISFDYIMIFFIKAWILPYFNSGIPYMNEQIIVWSKYFYAFSHFIMVGGGILPKIAPSNITLKALVVRI